MNVVTDCEDDELPCVRSWTCIHDISDEAHEDQHG